MSLGCSPWCVAKGRGIMVCNLNIGSSVLTCDGALEQVAQTGCGDIQVWAECLPV